MSEWIGVGLGLLSSISIGWLWWEFRKTRGHVNKIMEVLAVASPELERRVKEQGTQVIFNRSEIWNEDEEFVEEAE